MKWNDTLQKYFLLGMVAGSSASNATQCIGHSYVKVDRGSKS